jgi:phenylacetate-CoA ligase
MGSSLRERLPRPVRQFLRYGKSMIPHRIRCGRAFRETADFLEESQWWSRKDLDNYQMRRLAQLLEHAYANTVYYRRIFDERGLKPGDIQSFADLRKLPCLTKEIVRRNGKDLVATNFPESKREALMTSGTTDMPLTFYQEKGVAEARERAFIHHLWSRVGFRAGHRSIYMRGYLPSGSGPRAFSGRNPLDWALSLSSFHLNRESFPRYVDTIRRFRPDFLNVYPSAAIILAHYMKEAGVPPFTGIRAVMCSSETLHPWQRAVLEEVFGCRVYSFYGHSEKAVLAGECEESAHYHIQPEYGLVEVPEDCPTAEGEEAATEVVATSFNNFVMPLIRYRTRDLAEFAPGRCACGRNHSLIKQIHGRAQEYLVNPSGEPVTFTWADIAIWEVPDKVNGYQFIQDEPGRVALHIEPLSAFTPEEEEAVKGAFLKYYPNIAIELRLVDSLPRTKRGKLKYLIQNLPVSMSGETETT